MPQQNPPFPHLPLLFRGLGRARLTGGGTGNPQTEANKQNRAGHSAAITNSANNVVTNWRAQQAQRTTQGMPDVGPGMPLLLEIDPSLLDVDFLSKQLKFEIVAEHADGYIIVATEDTNIGDLQRLATEFSNSVRGSAGIAKVHRVVEDLNNQERLQRVLSDELYARWGAIDDQTPLTVEVGVVCVGIHDVPSPLNRRQRDTDATWAARQSEWAQERAEAYEKWDEIKSTREQQLLDIVAAYRGEVHQLIDGEAVHDWLPDSFSARITLPGAGLRDLALNYKYLFEVVEPDDVKMPVAGSTHRDEPQPQPELSPPDVDAPTVCVIDSGIQEGHALLQMSIDSDSSRSYVPGRENDVADHVRPGGHGTRVTGAVLFGERVLREGAYQLPFWVQNARVLDNNCYWPNGLFPAAAMRAIVKRYHCEGRQTRIFNHSINGIAPCRLKHMSSWAAAIDSLSESHDVLFVQSAGNILRTSPAPYLGVMEHLHAGRNYPDYLDEPSARVANPGQSLQALTVGSVGYGAYESGDWRTFVDAVGGPSSFSRSGLGIWGVIKPELVEFGGDQLRTEANPPTVSTPLECRDAYPELVRSTMYPPSPMVDRDHVGTSFAAPKVAHIVAWAQAVLPEESALLYRALAVNSARWPEWTGNATPDQMQAIIRRIGYGVPCVERATQNSQHRTTLIASRDSSGDELRIGARECHIFQIPLPPVIRSPADEFEVRIDVTLSYAARPRRTRRNPRRYLSTWVDWKSIKLGESFEAFRRRVLRDVDDDDENDQAPQGRSIQWIVGERESWGQIPGVRRSLGTVQKDWCIVSSNQLPEDFCVAVVGHPGWSSDPDSSAKYALAVSFDILGEELNIYEHVRVAVEELRAEIEIESGEIEVGQ